MARLNNTLLVSMILFSHIVLAIPSLSLSASFISIFRRQSEEAITHTRQSAQSVAIFESLDVDGPDSSSHSPSRKDLQRRNFVWTETRSSPQNLCGDSTFSVLGTTSPRALPAFSSLETFILDADCRALADYAVARPGFWLVTDSGPSEVGPWVEFDVLRSCKLAVQHADGGRGTIP